MHLINTSANQCCRYWCCARNVRQSGDVRGRSLHRTTLTVTASADEEAHRNKVKHLTRLFYATDSTTPASSNQRQQPRALQGSQFNNLPLWRVEWAVLPGMQEILHILAPHYVHMAEQLFSGPRPWLFGHLYLPGGSKNLGAHTHQLASGSKAPLVGVLMKVTRAVRLRDGKFLVLATALCRFKVLRCVRELPYSVVDVQLLDDCEVLEGLSQLATAAVMQSAADDTSVSALMAASTAAAREAAAAQQWAWLQGYELKVAARQEWPGPGPREGENDHEAYALVQELAEQGVADILPLPDGVVIGRCNLQEVAADAQAAVQHALQEAAAQFHSSSSSKVAGSTPEHEAASSAASADVSADECSSSSSSSSSSSPLSSTEGAPSIVSLNTTAERGVALQGPETTQLTASSSACGTLEELLLLEAAVWQQLDILAVLSSRVKGRRHSLPFGLLQLRPPQPQLSIAAATALANRAVAGAATSSSSSSAEADTAAGFVEFSVSAVPPAPAEVVSDTDDDDDDDDDGDNSSSSIKDASPSQQPPSVSSRSADASDPQKQWANSTAKYAFAASEGMDVHADPLWPPLRRAARLSWAAALVSGQVDVDKGDVRQALLETTSVAARLRFVLAVLQKHAKVLAALAAVKDVQE